MLNRAFTDFVIEAQISSNNIVSKVTSTIVNDMSDISNVVETKSESVRDLQFECRDQLFYYLINNEKRRLCISKIMQNEMFKLIHDQTHHEKFQRTYDRLCHSIYIRRMIKHLKQYIKHCLKCQLNQTKRHRSYDKFNSIISSFISFYIITMNFVMNLFFNKECNALLIIICKFIKKILLIFDHDI